MKRYNFKKKATLCLLCFTMLFIFIPSIVCAATNEQNKTNSDVEVQYCKTTDPGEICNYMYGKYQLYGTPVYYNTTSQTELCRYSEHMHTKAGPVTVYVSVHPGWCPCIICIPDKPLDIADTQNSDISMSTTTKLFTCCLLGYGLAALVFVIVHKKINLILRKNMKNVA